MKNRDKATQLLTKALKITYLGDYISSFAYAIILAEINNNPIYAGLIWPIRSLSQSAGSLAFPFLFKISSTNKILSYSQFTMGFLTLIMTIFLAATKKEQISSSVIILIWILLSILAQIFNNAKEAYSKELEQFVDQTRECKKKVSILIQIKSEFSFVFGQTGGPIIFVLFVYFFNLPLSLALLVDAFTFFVSWFYCNQLQNISCYIETISFRKIIKKLYVDKKLLIIFLIRSIIMWISMGIYNFILIPITVSQYHLDIKLSPILYSIIGLGGIIFAILFDKWKLNRFYDLIHNQSHISLAIFGSIAYSISCIILGAGTNLITGAVALVLMGFGNGFQRVGTRSIVRELCTSEQFNHIFSLEFFIAKLTDFIITMYFLNIFLDGKPASYGAYFSALAMSISLPLFLIIYYMDKKAAQV